MPIPESIASIFLDAPVTFVVEWTHEISGLTLLVVPALACAIVATQRHFARFNLALLVALSVYVPIVTLGGSPRDGLPLTPFAVVQCAYLVKCALDRRHTVFGRFARHHVLWIAAASVIAVVWGISSITGLATTLESYREQAARFERLSGWFSERGLDSAKAVFSDDGNAYLPGLEERYVSTAGGWGRIGIHGYREEFPSLPIDDPAAFIETCRDQGIAYWALTRNAGDVTDWLGRLLWTGEMDGVVFVGNVEGYSIFQVGALK